MAHDDEDMDFEEDEELTASIRKAKKKSIGKPSMTLADIPSVDDIAEFHPTGIGELDFTVGGLPKGCIVHLAAPTGAGKSTFSQQAAVFALSRLPENTKIGYCDFECRAYTSMLRYFCRKYGVSEERILFHQPSFGEEGCERIVEWIDDKDVVIIVADSLKAIVPKDSIAKSMTENEKQQAQAGIINRFTSTILAKIRHKKKTAILIDHLKPKQVKGMFFSINETASGETVKFFASARWFMKAAKKLEKTVSGEKKEVGREVSILIPKSTVSEMTKIEKMLFFYRRGISSYNFFFRRAIKLGLIKVDEKYVYIGTKNPITLKKSKKIIVEWMDTKDGMDVWRKIVDKIYEVDMPKTIERIRRDPIMYDMEIDL